jgi:superoxide reductase
MAVAMGQLYQSGDWKSEKHVPVIEVADSVKKGEEVKVKVSVGKEIAHPNKTEHHIRWIEVYFKPVDSKFPYQIGRFEFAAHGESTQGADSSGIYSKPEVAVTFNTEKTGTILATSLCNIHGLWESSKELTVE